MRGLVVASPANPTGTVLDPGELAALAGYCERTGIQLVSDEIYHGISYPGAPATSCGVGHLARGDRRQLLLQVLLDDRLAAGLAAGAAAAAARGRLPGRQLHRLPAGAAAATPRSARSPRRATPRPTGTSPATRVNRDLLLDGLARLGIDPAGPGRRRLLRLRRRRAPHRRLDGPDLPAARRDRGRGGARASTSTRSTGTAGSGSPSRARPRGRARRRCDRLADWTAAPGALACAVGWRTSRGSPPGTAGSTGR